jgi:DNA-directed RNA polymerase specialized sigma24 family protein
MSNPRGDSPPTDWIFDEQVARLIQVKARQLSRSPGFSLADQPDIEQELSLHLYVKAGQYNPRRSRPLTFASRIIKNKATSLLRQARAQRRGALQHMVSLSEPVSVDRTGVRELGNLLEETAGRPHVGLRCDDGEARTHMRLDVADANRRLPKHLRVMAALLEHVPRFAAGEVLGLSRRQTARWISELRAHYEACGVRASA